MITDEKLQKALSYLAETDEPCAKAKSYLAGTEKQEKTIIAIAFSDCLLRSVEERKQAAYRCDAYLAWQKKYQEAVYDFEIMRNKRQTAELIVEVWRTLQANQRRGNI